MHPRRGVVLPPQQGESSPVSPCYLVVKFEDSFQLPPYADNLERYFERTKSPEWMEIARLAPRATFRRIYRTLTPAQIDQLSARAAKKNPDYKPPQFLKNYLLVLPPGAPATRVLQVLRNWRGGVDRVYRVPQVAAPAPAGANPESQYQWYLGPAPLGIDARYAWQQLGGDGAKQEIIDIEQGWTLDHVDLLDANRRQRVKLLAGVPSASEAAHGTKVLGVICATDNDLGCVGIAFNTSTIGVISHGGYAFNIPEAIKIAANTLNLGGLILLEVSLRLREGKPLLPAEIDPLTFEEINLATALGLVVIEAAGNSNFPLDTYTDQLRKPPGGKVLYRDKLNKEFLESGAIMVGSGWRPDELATAATPWTRRPDSNYGTRIDCFAWGDSVQTLSSTASNPRGDYDSNFNGTSSAAAIIAGAALSLQGMAQHKAGGQPLGPRLDPQTVRDCLSNQAINTHTIHVPVPNTPPSQLPVDQVGVMPNLAQIGHVRLGTP